jgi:hypothetical protein
MTRGLGDRHERDPHPSHRLRGQMQPRGGLSRVEADAAVALVAFAVVHQAGEDGFGDALGERFAGQACRAVPTVKALDGDHHLLFHGLGAVR